jgi:acid phosphatase family membrane protein YuiD
MKQFLLMFKVECNNKIIISNDTLGVRVQAGTIGQAVKALGNALKRVPVAKLKEVIK